MRPTLVFVLLACFLLPTLSHAQAPWQQHILSSTQILDGAIDAADLNGDGRADLILSQAGASVNAQLQTDDGFQAQILFFGMTVVNDVSVADMDQDGDADVLMSTSAAYMSYLKNQGGTFTEYAIQGMTSYASMVRGGDVDGDGDMDLVYSVSSVWTDGELRWLENTGDGLHFNDYLIMTSGSEINDLNVGDVDGDGDLDIVTAEQTDGLVLWRNYGGGAFTPTPVVVTSSLLTAQLVDFDSDGDLDLFSEHTWLDNLDGSGMNWGTHIVTGMAGQVARPGDFDADGDMDVATIDDGHLVWREWDNNGFTQHVASDENVDFLGMVVADLDNDGDVDLGGIGFANQFPYPDAVFWYENNMNAAGPYAFAFYAGTGLPLVPESGGDILFDVVLGNPTGMTVNGHAWTEVTLPNGETYGPIQLVPLSFPPGHEFENVDPFVLTVPGYAPTGAYDFRVTIGVFPGFVADAGGFEFTKFPNVSGGGGTASDGWATRGLARLGDGRTADEVTDGLPTQFSLSQAYPNPFNPETTVAVTLPETAELTVTVYNLAGQQVAQLARGTMAAGTHELKFDGRGLASGLYFIHAQVPGQLNELRKVTLMK